MICCLYCISVIKMLMNGTKYARSHVIFTLNEFSFSLSFFLSNTNGFNQPNFVLAFLFLLWVPRNLQVVTVLAIVWILMLSSSIGWYIFCVSVKLHWDFTLSVQLEHGFLMSSLYLSTTNRWHWLNSFCFDLIRFVFVK